MATNDKWLTMFITRNKRVINLVFIRMDKLEEIIIECLKLCRVSRKKQEIVQEQKQSMSRKEQRTVQ